MKNLSFLLFVTVFSFSISAQQSKIDSLKIEFRKEKIDTTKAKILAKIGVLAYYINLDLAKKHNDTLIEFSKNKSKRFLAQGHRMRGTFYLLEGDFENSLKNYQISIDILRKIGRKKSVADLLGNVATLYGRNNNPEKAIEYYEKTIALNDSINNLKGNFNSYLNLAITYRGTKNYTNISYYLIKALEIAEEFNLENKSYVHNELAVNYLQLKSYEKAEIHIKDAIKLATEKKNKMALARAHESLAYLYEDRDKDFEKSALNYEKSLDYSTQMNDKNGIINSLYNVAYQYSCINKIVKAEEYFLKGLKISKEVKNNNYIISGNYHLANFYANKGKTSKARAYLKKANQLIGNNSKMSHKDIFELIGKSFEKNRNYKEAYKNMQMFAILTDSLYQKNGIGKIAEIETKYQTEKKEKENLQLKADNVEQELLTQKAERNNLLLVIGLTASLLTIGIFSFFYNRNKKQKNLIENLQKELHHRVKNNLAIIDTFIEVAKEEFNDKRFDTKLTEIQNRISSINEIHTQLYKSTDITNLNIKNYIDVLSKNVAHSFDNKDIRIHKSIEDISLNADTSFPVGLIINEFLTNSYKYAFDDKGTINIEMKDQGQSYLLTLSDNGKGLPKDFNIEETQTFGLRIMKLLTKQLDGLFELKNNNGVTLTINIPKA